MDYDFTFSHPHTTPYPRTVYPQHPSADVPTYYAAATTVKKQKPH